MQKKSTGNRETALERAIPYIYVASPVSAILYKCKVTKTDIPYDYRDGSLTITVLMKILHLDNSDLTR